MGFCTGRKQTKLWGNQSHKGLKANRYFMAFFSPNHQCCVRRWWQSFQNTIHDLRKWIRMQWKLFEMYIRSFASFAATSCVVAGYFSPIWNHTNGFIFVESRNAHGNRRRKNTLQFSTVKTHTFPSHQNWNLVTSTEPSASKHPSHTRQTTKQPVRLCRRGQELSGQTNPGRRRVLP